MADTPTESETLQLLRQAGLEREDLGDRLARHEYKAMKAELLGGKAMSFQIELSPTHPPPYDHPVPEYALEADQMSDLPTLPVPLGRIAWIRRPEDLPVTGILIEDLEARLIEQALLPLMAEHHRTPFSRLLFLCRSLAPVPLLARYGFLCHHVANQSVEAIGRVMHARHNMTQVRQLQNGEKLGQAG